MRQKKMYMFQIGDVYTISLTCYEAPGIVINKMGYPTFPKDAMDIFPREITICAMASEGVISMATVMPVGPPEYTWWERVKIKLFNSYHDVED